MSDDKNDLVGKTLYLVERIIGRIRHKFCYNRLSVFVLITCININCKKKNIPNAKFGSGIVPCMYNNILYIVTYNCAGHGGV